MTEKTAMKLFISVAIIVVLLIVIQYFVFVPVEVSYLIGGVVIGFLGLLPSLVKKNAK